MKKNGFTLVELLIVAIIIAIVAIVAVGTSFMTDTVTYTVTDKVRTGGESSKYLIFSESETFQNTDSWLDFKFNSSDFYGKIKVGKTYTSKVRGMRIPLFSAYRNIVTLKEVQGEIKTEKP